MPLSWNEIRDRAIAFARKWDDTSDEHAEAKSFMDDFFEVFGVPRKKVALFEKAVQKLDGKSGFIDLFWPGKLVIEFKSRGKDLKRALGQARDYSLGLTDKEAPKHILVCDFNRFKLYDLEDNTEEVFLLSELPKKVQLFGFIAGYEKHKFADQDPVNIEAAELMGVLHDELKVIGYDGHDLEVLLVRLLFCLFADDTGIFMPRGVLKQFIHERTSEDGSDLAGRLTELFETLNTPEPKRFTNLDDQLKQFPYVNGKLFEERIRTAHFSSRMRKQLIEACDFDWSQISPAVFGALFQSIMDDKARRNLGAHYTSEKNIMKLIKPLFLDELRAELETIKRSPQKLKAFHEKLRSLTFFDPACGCGNFLVISYRELRLLELDVLRALHKTTQLVIDARPMIKCNVDQFYGIEIEEFPAQIAQVALWLVDHQMNNVASAEFGQLVLRIPLTTGAKIVQGNALQIKWEDVTPKASLNFILGNPPFIGKKEQDDSQKFDMDSVFEGVDDHGVLDYVTAWYLKAAHWIKKTDIRVAFVSTNSISQGEQVGVFWAELIKKQGMYIHFAHRPFKWTNEAKGNAAVHVVIIGFGAADKNPKRIFEYENVGGDPHERIVSQINPYLVEGDTVFLPSRRVPMCPSPAMIKGSETTDDGHFLLTPDEASDFEVKHPNYANLIKQFVSGGDFVKGTLRYCLWLKGASPAELGLPFVRDRLDKVRQFRSNSPKARTREWAKYPSLFSEDRQPLSPYLVIPKVTSERRFYIPLAYYQPEVIINNTIQYIPNATLYHFGVLQSVMHMAWTRCVAGRMKSDYQYSIKTVYNNFPWPVYTTVKQKEAIEKAAQAVLDTREKFPGSSLADLYDPLTMPPELLKAHQTLDKAVDAAYGKRSFTTEADRVAFLFEQYQKLVSPLVSEEKPKKKKKKAA